MRWKRGDNIFHAKLLAIGELDALADLEHIGLAVIVGFRKCLGDIGDVGEAIGASRLLEVDEAVIESADKSASIAGCS